MEPLRQGKAPGATTSRTGLQHNMSRHSGRTALTCLDRMPDMSAPPLRGGGCLRAAFADVPELRLQRTPDYCHHSRHLCAAHRAGAPDDLRDQFIEELKARNVGVSVHFIALHTMSAYAKRFGYKPEDFPEGVCVLGERDQPAAVFDARREERGIRCGRGAGRCQEVQKIKKSQREPENEKQAFFSTDGKWREFGPVSRNLTHFGICRRGKRSQFVFSGEGFVKKQHKTRRALSYI